MAMTKAQKDRKVTRLHFEDAPTHVVKQPECGCPMCKLKRTQAKRENHTLSEGVYHEPPEQWQSRRVSDKSPRASLLRADENEFARINRLNAEFWKKRGGMPDGTTEARSSSEAE
jgi:hypothetical protein